MLQSALWVSLPVNVVDKLLLYNQLIYLDVAVLLFFKKWDFNY